MSYLRIIALGCFLLFSVSSCDLLDYDGIDEEQTMDGGGEEAPPCNKGCK